MSTQHTPGPWMPRNTPNRAFGAPDIWCIDWSDDQQEVAEIVHGEANAHLIAAAPDLLEALKEMVEIAELTIGWLPTPPNANGPLIQARAAIAKAEGGAA